MYALYFHEYQNNTLSLSLSVSVFFKTVLITLK